MAASFNIHHFKIGPFEIGLDDHSVVDGNGTIEYMQPKFIEVLHYLALRHPNLVTREELIENVWNGNQYVGEKALTNAIWNIRKKLHGGGNEYIRTVRKSGYRLTEKPELPKLASLQRENQEKKPAFLGKLALLTVFVFSALLIGTVLLNKHWSDQDLLRITSITSSPGKEVYPSMSRDGGKVLFYWKRINENQDLFYLDIHQPDLAPVQLTFDSEKESRPVWNYDSTEVFYIQKSWDKKFCHVIKLDVKTRLKKQIASCNPNVNPALSISLDGKTLAMASFDDVVEEIGIYTIDLTQPNSKPVRFSCTANCEFSDRDAIFSPNGQDFLINRRSQQSEEDIFLVNRSTRESKRLTRGQGNIQGMAWHPKANKVVFSAEYADIRNGYVLDLDTNEVKSLGVEGFSFPSFIGESNDLVYHELRVKKYISSLELGKDTPSIPFPVVLSEYIHGSAAYSPQANKIAYISNESGYREIWLTDEKGANRKQLTHLNSNLYFPNWSPDGKQIAFLVRHTASSDKSIRIIDVENLSIKTLQPPNLSDFLVPTWASDNMHILSSAKNTKAGEDSAYYKINIETNEANVISKDSGGFILFEPENDLMWYSTESSAIYRAQISNPDDSKIELIPPGLMSSDYSWTKTENGLYFLQNHIDHQSINFYSFTDHVTTTVLKAPLKTLENYLPLSYIPNTKQLLITQSSFPEIDIKKLSHPLLAN